MIKRAVFITVAFILFCLSSKAQLNIADSVVKTIHSYDSLVFIINSDTTLQRKDVEGAQESLKHYKGVVFYRENSGTLLKLELFFDTKPEEKVTIDLYQNRIIIISIAELKYYIIHNNCFLKENTPALYSKRVLKNLEDFEGVVKDFISLFEK
jgi:hypothetical protein